VDGLSNTEFEIPSKFVLEENYPNPFNPTTNIRYGLPHVEHVKFFIYNVLGREVAVLLDDDKMAAYHIVQFDARDKATGVYS